MCVRFSELQSNRELFDTFVELLASGAKRQQVADAMNINKGTVTDWKRMPEVQQALARKIQERANAILRQVDTRIEKKLEQDDWKPSVETLLKIRSTFAGESINLNVSGDGAQALQDLMAQLDEHPELAQLLGAGIRNDDSG